MIRLLLDRLYRRNVAQRLVTVLGLDSAGKTTLVYKLVTGDIVKTSPTLSINIETTKAPMGHHHGPQNSLVMNLVDVGQGCGTMFYYHRASPYTRIGDAIVWVVDGSDADRLDESVKLLALHLRFADADPEPRKDKECPILMFVFFSPFLPLQKLTITLGRLANKRDMPGAIPATVIRDKFAPVCTHHAFEVFPTSMTESIRDGGMPEAFAWLQGALDKPPPPVRPGPGPESAHTVSSVITLPDTRSAAALAEKLESWLARTETDTSPEEFLSQFDNICLPTWDHYTHIRIAYTILTTHGRQKGEQGLLQ